MPPLPYWFTGSGLASFLALLATLATLGYGWYRGAMTEYEAAKGAIETKENRARADKIKSLLVTALNNSDRILRSLDKDKVEQSTKDAEAWGSRTHDLLSHALGDGEAALFLSNSGYIFYGDGSEISQLRNWIDGRQRRLTELLGRSSSLLVKSDVDPSKFE
jgi:hypothetical protein